MSAFAYIETDMPAGMSAQEYRRIANPQKRGVVRRLGKAIRRQVSQ